MYDSVCTVYPPKIRSSSWPAFRIAENLNKEREKKKGKRRKKRKRKIENGVEK